MTRAAPYSSARFSLPRVPTVPITIAPACTANCVANRPRPPPIACRRMTSPGLVTLTLCKHVPSGQRLNRKGRGDLEAHRIRDPRESFRGDDAALGEAAGFLGERRDAVADGDAANVGSERGDAPR